ncbi:site-specific integrase [Candidatus Woesearchaeota archaeon]|nr:site-specific integrase [Candidatus Woesearchaeota archaeon]
MRQVLEVKQKRHNFFITDQEAGIIWNESKYYEKLHLMIGFALFRGLRIGEIRALNITDFEDNFNKVTVIIQKSNIKDTLPLIQEFAEVVRAFVKKNLHTFDRGYFFPHYRQFDSSPYPYLASNTVNIMFYNFRKRLIKKYPQFADKSAYGNGYKRHRLGWHSLRRWFETRLWESGNNPEQISHIMRYRSPKVVYQYLDSYRTWKTEGELLKNTFSGFLKEVE